MNTDMRQLRKRVILFLVFAICCLTACQSQKAAPKPVHVPPDLEKILVVSFRDMNEDKADRVSIRCPLSGKIFVAGPVAERAEAFLTGQLKEILKDRRDFKFISPQKVWDIHANLLDRGEEVSERKFLVEIGRQLGAEGVIAGHIYRFQERVGGKYSAESPASVAFDLHLVRVADGQVLWTGYFDETQKALTDDLFQLGTFLKRDGQWVTAEVMAAAGLKNVFEAFKKP
ncbi:hypothetical protein DENIS_1017 [Desulfonema ishimotonii]|uniref:Penicillin-binding protein activator LpoB n=1 Tax=Desulfonema ishimotonii TaxID=45657 RepID=A0A401FSY3_9BACT|nr:hypothetical protein [Desulfonema ishimotonii]GBC60074.1 hypothetical protein DENIS_1017 [Desulfonema ishimotonii]